MCMDASTIRKTVSPNPLWLHNQQRSRLSPLQHLLPFRPPPRPRRLSVLLSMTVIVAEDVAALNVVTGNRDRHLYQHLRQSSRHPRLSSRQRPPRPRRFSVLSSRPGSPQWCLQFRPPCCLLYTSDAADDLLCVDLGGRRIIKK